MSKFFETEEFKKLNDKWNKKLSNSGFCTIEQEDGNLKSWSSGNYSRRPVWDSSKEEYYRLAGNFLYDNEFDTELEKIIWERHSAGGSVREITSFLGKKKKSANFSFSKVYGVIKKLESKMKTLYAIKGK